MAKITVDTFLEYLQRSQVLTSKELEGIRDLALGFDDATEFARLLSKRELLSRWQAAQILAGRTQLHLGKYKLVDRLGRGGMGNVFLAEHTSMNRRVALKVVSHKKDDSTAVELLRSEARAIGQLDHPNIIQAYDVAITKAIVSSSSWSMSKGAIWTPSSSMRDRSRWSAPSTTSARRRKGWSTPTRGGWSIATSNRPISSSTPTASSKSSISVSRGFPTNITAKRDRTRNAPLGGTIDYQAPEHARGTDDFDSRADIYSLGCTLYCLLVGRPPFAEGSQTKRILQHQTEPPPDLRSIRPSIPEDLNAICLRMLEKDPDARYQTASEVAEVLGAWSPPDPAAAFADSDPAVDVLDGPLGNLNPQEMNTLQEPPDSSAVRRHRQANTLTHLWVAATFVVTVVVFLLIIILIVKRADDNYKDISRPINRDLTTTVNIPQNSGTPSGAASANPKDTGGSTTPENSNDSPGAEATGAEVTGAPGPTATAPPTEPGTSEGGSASPDSGKTGTAPKSTPPEPSPSGPSKPGETEPAEPKQPKPPEPKPPKPKPIPVFNTFPKVAPLPAPSERAQIPLGALEGPADVPLSLKLLGGAFRVSSESLEFRLIEEESGKVWNVELDATPVARIERDANRILFQWDAGIPDAKATQAALLQYTILQVTSGDETRDLLFTRPVEIPPLSGEFKKDGTLKRDLPELPVRDVDSFRVALTEIVGPTGAVPLKGKVEPLDARHSQRTIQVPDLKAAEVELMFILAGSRDSVNMRVKYGFPGAGKVPLTKRQWDIMKRGMNSPNPQVAAGAKEVLTLVDEFTKTGKVHFRAYRQIGDKQIDVIVTKK